MCVCVCAYIFYLYIYMCVCVHILYIYIYIYIYIYYVYVCVCNFGKFIHQIQPETKTLIRKLERILIKLYRQNVSLLLNE